MAKIYLKSGEEFKEALRVGIKNNGQWYPLPVSHIYVKAGGVWTDSISASAPTSISVKTDTEVHSLEIGGMGTVAAESCRYVAVYDGEEVTGSSWSVTGGAQYATVAQDGTVTIDPDASDSQVTLQVTYRGLTAERTVSLTYAPGSSGDTSVESSENSLTGEVTTVMTTVVENQNGSSSVYTESVTTDGQGNIVESSETVREEGSDGSYTQTTTTYGSDGDPVSGRQVSGDTTGNVSTRSIEYDEEGNADVTGYTIDTSGSQGEGKAFNGNGVNTEYYALDVTRGFVMDLHFTIDFTAQPAGQNDNHHNILNSKRATPEPWYGFQIRQSSTNKYITLGTQFSTGTNTNSTVTTTSANRYGGSSNVYEYNFHITYNPTAAADTFTCTELIGGYRYVSSLIFPDISDMKYIKTTIGCALDSNGDPFRFSNINVKDFSIECLRNVASPVIGCDGQNVTISCSTVGASIYYRFGETGSFTAYTGAISISDDTLVQAYAELEGEKSLTVTRECTYDNGIAAPVVTCDGEYVSIACATTDADIFYRTGESGEYGEYTDSFPILETTVVEAYAKVGSETGRTVRETCTYSPVVLEMPSVICSGDQVTITCATQGATIMYRMNGEGSFLTYTSPVSISSDTVFEAYSEFRGRVSQVVTLTCEYSPVHHYENDYLTFRVRTAGSLYWRANGSLVRSIDYSLNGGSWTTITSAATPPTISVAAGDVVRFRGTNASYATSKSAYSGFGHGEAGTAGTSTYDSNAAEVDIEGNIMSLVYGDGFVGQTAFNGGTYNFCSMFKKLKVVSAENLVLPALTLTQYCYRAMFSWCTYLTKAPQLPATTLAKGVYWYMFERCAITTAPDLLAEHLVTECYGSMFVYCSQLNYIKCMAIDGFNLTNCKQTWVNGVAASGTFVKDSGVTTGTWTTGTSGIPSGWLVYDDQPVVPPEIAYDGFSTVTMTCSTQGADIYYRTGGTGEYAEYTGALTISSDTAVQAYSSLNGQVSRTVTRTCLYVSDVPVEASNRDLRRWQYSGQEITTPYSVNAVDGHSASYAKGSFTFETDFAMRTVQPAHLWFQHADQSAAVYIDDVLVGKHWGGYTAFTMDISGYVHTGTNRLKVILKNNEGNSLAPAAGDFNFNATLGNVRLLTSPWLPDPKYGYDGFHITSAVTGSSATVNVRTTVPSGASVTCSITDGTYSWSDTMQGTGTEMTFTATIPSPHLWNGTTDPHLYTVTMDVCDGGGVLYHRFTRGYGLRYYEYVIGDTEKAGTQANPYTGFLLNGSPYLLRGCCMHDDIEGRANALTEADYDQTFSVIRELGCNFLRLAHYPHPKEVYDRCDALGIVVQTEGPCVNKLQSTMPEAYYENLEDQYKDMVSQHYNHPCIMFWGLSNETTTDDKAFAKEMIEGYTSLIKSMDSERMVGYVLAQGPGTSPSAYYNDPAVDWFGCNIYVGWYDSPNSNTPAGQLNTRISNTIGRVSKPVAYSEYGCGGTQGCHSEEFLTTTTRGNYERHDIEYQMWLHEGHIATIKNYPQLMFTSQWQLFDIAVANRNEGYTVCPDGETTSTDDSLRRLNNKGLVERDHRTRKDTFYLYKAWWNPVPFIHICGKDYTRKTGRKIKCYTNGSGTFTLYVNGTAAATAQAVDSIVEFAQMDFDGGDVVRVSGTGIEDTFTFE